MTSRIPCSEYDYFEIACTFKLKIELTLINGSIVTGNAKGLYIDRVDNEAKEWLTLEHPTNKVELTQIKLLTALEPNPHFKQVQFHVENGD